MTAPEAASTLRINGDDHEVVLPKTVAELLADLELDVRHVAVERNRELVPKREFGDALLADGDVLEIVTFVGGG